MHMMDLRSDDEKQANPDEEIGPDGHPVGRLYVQRAQTKKERQAELRNKFSETKSSSSSGVNLYVKNLEPDVDDDSLRQLFEPFGQVTSASAMKDASGKCKGFGFVCFATPDDATKAVTEMHLKVVKGKPLYVGLAERKEARQERLRQRYVGAPGTSYKGSGPSCSAYVSCFWLLPSDAAVLLAKVEVERAAMAKASKDGMGIPTNMEAYSSQGMMMNMGGMGAMGGMGGMGMPGMGGMMRPPMMGMMQPPMQAMNNAMPKFGKGGFDGGGGGGMMPNQMAMKGMPPSGKGTGMGPMPMNAMGPMGGGMMRPPQPCGMQQMMRPNPPQPMSGPQPVSGPVQKQMIGEKLYPLVAKYQPEWAGKITGMMLEMDNSELLMLLESESQLRGKVDEAVRVIQSARRP
ncbi:PAB1 [Symbiodinium microadriaticum]|nr:PAB1 [Symbiodinium microadriaticum]